MLPRVGASALLAIACMLIAANTASAQAGPGAPAPASNPAPGRQPTPGDSGGATVALSGQTLAAGQTQIVLALSEIDYHADSDAAVLQAARRAGAFSSVNREISPTLELDYGLTPRLQIGVQGGYFVSQGYHEGDLRKDGSVLFGTASFAGPADTWLLAKYAVLDDNRLGFLSPYVGLKFPTGRNHVRLSDGILIKATDQPGTGAYDFKLGLAYSRFLTDRITTDASAEYVIHTEHADAKVGNNWTLAIDAAYRLSESTQSLPRFAIFAQVFATILDKDTLFDAEDPNSGGATLYLGPGLFVQLTDSLSLTVGPAFPVYQQLYGDQVKAQVQYLLSVDWTF
ncbi:MAG TPA: transporter [Tepidisphaeraceae bacterium]|jgi:outer membrane protein W|nr:transporter [Tepidisphaeraceae bacterium]